MIAGPMHLELERLVDVVKDELAVKAANKHVRLKLNLGADRNIPAKRVPALRPEVKRLLETL